MKRRPLIMPLLAAGFAWTAAASVLILALERERGRESGGLGFVVNADGRYHLSPCEGTELYAMARRTEHQARTAYFLWWPVYDHYWGEWEWTQWAGSGAGRNGTPAPRREDFAEAVAELTAITRLPGLDYLRVAVPGGHFDQRIYYWRGALALLVCSLFIAGPATVFLARGASRATAKRRTSKRVALGLCPVCGYDRASIGAQSACPECGGTA